MKTLVIFFILLIQINNVHAYVFTKTESGENTKWSSETHSITINASTHLVGTNSIGITSSDVETILNSSIQQWNRISPITLKTNYTNSLPALGTSNTFRFSSDRQYFGSGVLAVTSVLYSASSGSIISADILVNESMSNPSLFTDNPLMSSGVYAYLGDVLTHELGHFIGLGHSETIGSTMNFSIFKDQYDIESDDKKGVEALYHGNSSKAIFGRVIGGANVSVFGAYVQLIDTEGGVIAGVFSEEDGSFIFNNIPEGNYVIYINPPKKLTSLSEYYQSVQTDFCPNEYKASFYRKCGNRSRGRPQVIEIDNSSVDVGNVTIRCDYGFDPSYLLAKVNSFPDSYDLAYANGTTIMNSQFYGVIQRHEIDDAAAVEKFEIDMSRYPVNGSSDYNLSLVIQTEALASMVDLSVKVKRVDELTYTTYSTPVVNDVSGVKKELDLKIAHPMSDYAGDNFFEILITGSSVSSFQQTAILGAPSIFKNTEAIYYLSVAVSHNLTGLSSFHDSESVEDNTYCTEADNTYSVQGVKSFTQSNAGSSFQQQNGLTCGSIDIDDSSSGGGTGMVSLVLGLFAIFLLTLVFRVGNFCLNHSFFIE